MAIDLHLEPDDSATPLTAEEQRDLKPSHIAFKHELNEAEQENILRAQAWALKRSTRVDILTEDFIIELHRRMLKEVWKWAGKFRRTERNIGIDWWLIPTQLRTLLDDVNAWIRYGAYPAEEIAVRFHHRLVAIHPFPNGNGRHARLIADMLIMRMGGQRFTWGSASLRDMGEIRKRYIAALKAADSHDIGPLLAFAQS